MQQKRNISNNHSALSQCMLANSQHKKHLQHVCSKTTICTHLECTNITAQQWQSRDVGSIRSRKVEVNLLGPHAQYEHHTAVRRCRIVAAAGWALRHRTGLQRSGQVPLHYVWRAAVSCSWAPEGMPFADIWEVHLSERAAGTGVAQHLSRGPPLRTCPASPAWRSPGERRVGAGQAGGQARGRLQGGVGEALGELWWL